MGDFQKELSDLLNKYNQESDSDTPDYILAAYLARCLSNYALTVKSRDVWMFSVSHGVGNGAAEEHQKVWE